MSRLHDRSAARAAACALGALLATLTVVPGAAAQLAPGGDVVVLTGPVHVAEDDLVGSLVVLQGPTRVDGFVAGDVIAVSGDVEVSGTIGGDLIVLQGAVRLTDTATIQSDVIATTAPTVAPGAMVAGAIRPLETRAPVLGQILAGVASWIAITASVLMLALLLAALVPPRAADAVHAAAQRAPGTALGVGLLVAIAVPVIAWGAMVTLVGIPLGLAMFLAIALLSACGYVGAAWVLGRRLEDTSLGARWARVRGARLISLLIGLALLRAVALVPIVGIVLWVVASSFGAGAALLALVHARRGPVGERRRVPRELPGAVPA